mmetsp:Transcript_14215/g.30108  ORF Transcript_14215/g.30108 Transcript_14215/m.30108 type:complete len:290 (-) Transcript_14215:65-934(-)
MAFRVAPVPLDANGVGAPLAVSSESIAMDGGDSVEASFCTDDDGNDCAEWVFAKSFELVVASISSFVSVAVLSFFLPSSRLEDEDFFSFDGDDSFECSGCSGATAAAAVLVAVAPLLVSASLFVASKTPDSWVESIPFLGTDPSRSPGELSGLDIVVEGSVVESTAHLDSTEVAAVAAGTRDAEGATSSCKPPFLFFGVSASVCVGAMETSEEESLPEPRDGLFNAVAVFLLGLFLLSLLLSVRLLSPPPNKGSFANAAFESRFETCAPASCCETFAFAFAFACACSAG